MKLKVTQIAQRDRPAEGPEGHGPALGLHRISDSVVKEDRPEIRGMIAKVQHLVEVEEVATR